MDVGFKTAVFGGFDKADVLEYIELQKNEEAVKIAALHKRIAELENLEDASVFTTELYARIEQIETENKAYLETLQNKIDILEEENASLRDTNKAYLEEMSVLSERAKQAENMPTNTQELDDLRNKNEELNAIIAEYKQQIEELRQQNEERDASDVTNRLGSTMIKAQLFADELIQNARDEAKTIYNSTALDLTQINTALSEIEEEINDFNGNFNTQINSIVQELNKISGKVTATATNISKK
ncbi:MAG TPA: hypothetical protein GXZ23_05725 [Clostridiales bacterium]|nr:hypothetical protein [Clostridiales bacterium]